jgi:RNA polymerase sigma factor (sigma-70 family)
MSTTLPRVDEPSDAELISAVRSGDNDAYGVLFQRHSEAAERLARQLIRPPDADDLVSEAFAKVLTVLQRGAGPDVAFRAYLLTAVRRLHVDRLRQGARVQPTGDLEPFDPGVPFRDTAVEGFENESAAKAFASLPERWQMVLWHTEVEGQRPADIAPLLGMSANSVSALAYRAREGLRQAFLSAHALDTTDATCRWVHEQLGAHVRGGLAKRDAAKVEEHLQSCRACTAVYLELTEVNSGLSGLLAPLLLGAAATGYLAAAGGTAAKAGVVVLALGRLKDLVLANSVASAAAGAAATVVVVGGGVVAVQSIHHGSVAPLAEEPVATGAAPTTLPAPAPTSPTASPPASSEPTTPRAKRVHRSPRPTTEAQVLPTPASSSSVPAPVTSPVSSPVSSPGSSPVPAPHQQAHPGQHPTPADQDDPPPIDVRVSASVEHLADGFRIIVTVSGRSNGPIELAASSAVRPAMTSTDQRCRPDGPRFLRCELPRGTS